MNWTVVACVGLICSAAVIIAWIRAGLSHDVDRLEEELHLVEGDLSRYRRESAEAMKEAHRELHAAHARLKDEHEMFAKRVAMHEPIVTKVQKLMDAGNLTQIFGGGRK
jgi:hypothetical protein